MHARLSSIASCLLPLALIAYSQSVANQLRFTIHTPEGSVSVLDFRGHVAGSIGDTLFFLEENSRFSIDFLKADDSFGIVISGTPVNVVRKDAEDRLLRDLGISEKDACKLKVIVRVSASHSLNSQDGDEGLSFCPSSTLRE